MDPYEVLGIPSSASDSEIKKAYRRLVKQYHPDATKGKTFHEEITRINHAYDILSDPQKKAAYDNRFADVFSDLVTEEDPRDVYRREYLRKKYEQQKREQARSLGLRVKTVRLMWWVNAAIFLFTLSLYVDTKLPETIHQEIAEMGWQKRSPGSRYSQGELKSYMKTQHFSFQVPDHIHLYYDYDENQAVLSITVTRIYKIVTNVSVVIDQRPESFSVRGTLISSGFHVIVLLSALGTLFIRRYSAPGYSLIFIPLLFLGILMVIGL